LGQKQIGTGSDLAPTPNPGRDRSETDMPRSWPWHSSSKKCRVFGDCAGKICSSTYDGVEEVRLSSVFVEPANLTVHISALRRTLRDGRDGNRFIINIPGRGYRSVGSIKVPGDEN
jgi:hypothetical protein